MVHRLRLSILALLLLASSAVWAQSSTCVALLGQLDAAERRASADPGRAAQYESALERQRAEIARTADYAASIGCDTAPNSAQCPALDDNIDRMRRNLARLEEQAAGLVGRTSDATLAVARIEAALRQAGCAGYAGADARAPSLFEGLFGGPSTIEVDPVLVNPDTLNSQSPTIEDMGEQQVRTLCVRKCDGFYFPISYATTSASFAKQENICKKLCPAAQAELFAYSPELQQPDDAVSTSTGEALRSMPNAFRFRKAYDPACFCKRPDESWAQALAPAESNLAAEEGDITVTEERSREMAKPRAASPAPAAKTEAVDPEAPSPQPPEPERPLRKKRDAAKAKAASGNADATDGIGLDGATTVEPQ